MTKTLDTWLAEEAKAMAIFAAGPGDGVASRDQIAPWAPFMVGGLQPC